LLQFFNLGVTGLVIGNVTFALVVCILNWRSIGKALGYTQEVKTTFGLPLLCAVIMGIGCKIIYEGVHYVIGSTFISFVFAFLVALLIYGTMLLVFNVLTEQEILEMPLGRSLHKILAKLEVF
ncbi:MAG: polysaccharide biosynthesis C-terminal domain-containing protein, partial [Lachnospiraceae bacterium]|nr:polysaccharide biosynthesis C-terminal domain-containing protein [Lachnospiraceae bacterium]